MSPLGERIIPLTFILSSPPLLEISHSQEKLKLVTGHLLSDNWIDGGEVCLSDVAVRWLL